MAVPIAMMIASPSSPTAAWSASIGAPTRIATTIENTNVVPIAPSHVRRQWWPMVRSASRQLPIDHAAAISAVSGSTSTSSTGQTARRS